MVITLTVSERSVSQRTPAQIQEWIESLNFWIGTSVRYAEANYWPQNESACHKYGGCRFRGICKRDPHVRQNFLETEFEKQPWNPLKPRTEAASDAALEMEE